MMSLDTITTIYIFALLILAFYVGYELLKILANESEGKVLKLHRLTHIELTLILLMVESMAGIVFTSMEFNSMVYNSAIFNILVFLVLFLNVAFSKHLMYELETR